MFFEGFLCGLAAFPLLCGLVYVIRNIDKNLDSW